MNKEGIETPQQVSWSPAHCQQSLLAQSPCLHRGGSGDQGKRLSVLQQRSSPGSPGTSQLCHISVCCFHAQVPGPAGKLGSAAVRDVGAGPWDVGRLQQAVPAAHLGFAAVPPLEGFQFLLLFPDDWLLITAWRVSECQHVLSQGCRQEGLPYCHQRLPPEPPCGQALSFSSPAPEDPCTQGEFLSTSSVSPPAIVPSCTSDSPCLRGTQGWEITSSSVG